MRNKALSLMLFFWACCTLLYSADARPEQAEFTALTFAVRHDHFLGADKGSLTFDNRGVRYHADKKKEHSAVRSFSEIQEQRVKSPQKVVHRSYLDTGWKLNRDRRLEFRLLEGEIDFRLVEYLKGQLGGEACNRRICSGRRSSPPAFGQTQALPGGRLPG